jgi:hypothetical protein
MDKNRETDKETDKDTVGDTDRTGTLKILSGTMAFKNGPTIKGPV